MKTLNAFCCCRLGVGLVLGLGLPLCATAADEAPVVCDARDTWQALNAAGVPKAQQAAAVYPQLQSRPALCNSLLKILARLASGQKAGGRKLEGDKALDVAAAQRERQTALAEAGFRAEFEALTDEENDAVRKLVLEAALLHNHGFYLARDLLLRQLASGGGG